MRPWSALLLLPAALAAAEPAALDRAWALPTLLEDPDGPVLRRLRLTGRFHLDRARVETNRGHDEQWNIRRLRLGAHLRLAGDITLHGEAEFNPQERDPTYVRASELHLAWTRGPALTLRAGKQAAHFTLEGSTSSNELLTVDRSPVYANLGFPEEFFTGIAASGRTGRWVWHGGVFSSGEKDREFGRLNAGAFGVVSLGADLAAPLRADEAAVTLELVHQEEDEGNDMTRPLSRVGSLHGRFRRGRAGVQAELAAAEGSGGQADLRSALLMPHLFLTDRLQAVLRFTWLESADAPGVRLARYENGVSDARGDRLREGYAGLNAFLRGHQLKLQTGLAWTDLDGGGGSGGDLHGWSWVTGLRLAW